MVTREREFPTEGEANAFLEGVELVNDSAISWHPAFATRGADNKVVWKVILHDDDYVTEAEPGDICEEDAAICPLCGRGGDEEKATERGSKKKGPEHVLYNRSEVGFWSNDDGWGSFEQATRFYQGWIRNRDWPGIGTEMLHIKFVEEHREDYPDDPDDMGDEEET